MENSSGEILKSEKRNYLYEFCKFGLFEHFEKYTLYELMRSLQKDTALLGIYNSIEKEMTMKYEAFKRFRVNVKIPQKKYSQQINPIHGEYVASEVPRN